MLYHKSIAFIQPRRKKQRKGKRKLYKRKGEGEEKRRTHYINGVLESQSGHFYKKFFKIALKSTFLNFFHVKCPVLYFSSPFIY